MPYSLNILRVCQKEMDANMFSHKIRYKLVMISFFANTIQSMYQGTQRKSIARGMAFQLIIVTIEYSLESLCVYVRVCVCVLLCFCTITQKEIYL